MDSTFAVTWHSPQQTGAAYWQAEIGPDGCCYDLEEPGIDCLHLWEPCLPAIERCDVCGEDRPCG